MSTKKDVIEDLIKDVIDYLADVYKGKKIGGKSQGFFVSSEELDKMLNKYFIFFKNRNELINDVKYNYSLIKDFSFPNEKGDFIYVKDLSNENTVFYSLEQHQHYSYRTHSHLIKVFEDKLGIKEEKKTKRITVKNKRTVDVVKRLNLEVEFLREDCTPEDFIDVLKGTSEKGIYININNRNFHYLLSKIKEYFYNFSITAVAETNKIHSKNGTLFTANNLNNAKVDYPSLKERIDSVFLKL